MKPDYDSLIHLNVEIEGLLKVLRDRDSLEARSLLADKYEQYRKLIESIVGEPLQQAGSRVEAAAESVAQVATHIEVKDQEAEEAEIDDEDDDAVSAIEHGESRTDVNTALKKSFTLNDKFRFIREVFGGNEQDFNDTIDLLAQMDSYKEAADYIKHDLQLDPENQDVADFLDFIAKSF